MTEESQAHFLPPAIPGCWWWSGPWLMLDRVLGRHQELSLLEKLHDSRHCPDCLSSNTMVTRDDCYPYPYAHYCFDCGLVWRPYLARCPLCKGGWREAGFVRRQESDNSDNEVRCEKCGEVLSTAMVKKCNEEEDFDLGDEL